MSITAVKSCHDRFYCDDKDDDDFLTDEEYARWLSVTVVGRGRALDAIRPCLPKREAERLVAKFDERFSTSPPDAAQRLVWFVIEACRSGHVPHIG